MRRMKRIPAAAIVTQMLLGNLCLTPGAYAHPAPQVPQPATEVTHELAMTPADAMSPVRCDVGCITVPHPRHLPTAETARKPCADSHCLTDSPPSAAFVSRPSREGDGKAVAVPPAAGPLELHCGGVAHSEWYDGTVSVSHQRAVVLRQ